MNIEESVKTLNNLVEQVMGAGGFKKISDLDKVREAIKTLADVAKPDNQ